MTTDIQATINRLKELEQKASPAPWEIEPYYNDKTQNDPTEKIERIKTPAGSVEEIDTMGYDYGLAAPTGYDFLLITALRNAAPALIADHEATARKLAIYEKRMAYLAKNYPLVHADALEHAPEKEN